MMTKPLALLSLICCITALHAFQRPGCRCIKTSLKPIVLRVIKKVEMTPVSGHCRWTEIIVTRRNGSKVCVDPNAPWINDFISKLQNTTVPPRSSTVII